MDDETEQLEFVILSYGNIEAINFEHSPRTLGESGGDDGYPELGDRTTSRMRASGDTVDMDIIK